ncbi:hypothetical protein [Halorarius litoreus]|uniref:hypothetical protein n=1 Tax=Halorarius litoreus TaxID=2962676 RepID=UPI0020CCCB2B|nr:hypothetical protein [Halorarius litoreus]
MSRRGRRVPEAAPLVGVVLAFSVALFGYLFAPTGTLLPIFLVALLLLYGFTAYGIVRSPDPAAVLPPDAVLAVGVLTAGLLGGYGFVVAGQPMFALFVALVAGVPPALYHARYGESVNPLGADVTLLVALVVGAAVLVVGVVLVGDPAMAALDAVVVVLAAADYRDTRGTPLPDLLEFSLVAATLGGAALSVLYFALVAGDPVVGLLVGGSLLVVGAFFAIGDR